ncbi:UdgX family uracil-DNA binding protein [Paracoccus albus]|uniref:UdgX family uracil-DNA binding protein n=1 Tax=Paracoccus albus TaxID=3017784 RepID=UPI0022F0DCA5|nr:UdgX family uracil-DNA binding protein [Paracoccus albus]WBU62156.1 UdgX family uracil-DNA binding protein [Paracoccus albus]
MYRAALPAQSTVPRWREIARRLASHRIAAEDIEWTRQPGDNGLFDTDPLPSKVGPHPVIASKTLLDLTGTVLCHADPQAPALAYRVLLRHQIDRHALSNPADALTQKLRQMEKSVRRDVHKMHAFVRFREIPSDTPRRSFAAWFEPQHFITERSADFFARRFADMDWLIATPEMSVIFREGVLEYAPAPHQRPDLPEDASEALWATYFRNIFNPARVKISAMKSEMPVKYWKNMPETRLIPQMLAEADARVAAMRAALPSDPPERAARILDRLPSTQLTDQPETLEQAREAAMSCTRCDLCQTATQTVWGEGDPSAALMIVGEQPGDQEDLRGRPFVGPAGQLLREMMQEAELGPVWLTNAVKHFKFRPRGKLRLHQNPNRGEIQHCRWWLDLERRFIAPKLTLALGATAAFSLTGNSGSLRERRGKIEQAMEGGPILISWHPSYILRLSGEDAEAARSMLLEDLQYARHITK